MDRAPVDIVITRICHDESQVKGRSCNRTIIDPTLQATDTPLGPADIVRAVSPLLATPHCFVVSLSFQQAAVSTQT